MFLLSLGLWVVTFVIEHQHIDVPALLWLMGCHICYRAPTYRCSCSTLGYGSNNICLKGSLMTGNEISCVVADLVSVVF